MNDATAQMGVQFGKSAVAAGQDYVEKNVSGRMSLLCGVRLIAVHSVPALAADQDVFCCHEFLRSYQTPAHSLSLATQALV